MLSSAESDELWKAVLQSLRGVGMAILDRDGYHLDIRTDETMSRQGWTRERVIGKSMSELHGEQAGRILAIVRHVFDTQEGADIPAFPVESPQGRFWHTASLSPVLDEYGSTRVVLALIYDVTQRLEAQQALEASRNRLVEVQETERKWLAMELHDSLCQELAATKLLAASGSSDMVADECDRMLSQVRQICRGLYPVSIQTLGLSGALRELAEAFSNHGPIHLTLDNSFGEKRLAEPTEIALFRITQEAVANAIRHGKATEVHVRLYAHQDEIQVRVEDNGCGFDADACASQGLGLTIMRHRAGSVGGRLMIEASDAGTTVTACVLETSPQDPT